MHNNVDQGWIMMMLIQLFQGYMNIVPGDFSDSSSSSSDESSEYETDEDSDKEN